MPRTTRPIVRQIDRVGAIAISVGGIGIIAAVLVVMLYLLSDTIPLFRSGSLYDTREGKVALAGKPVDMVADEYKGLAIVLLNDGRAQPIELQGMTPLPPFGELSGGNVTAVSVINEYGQMAVGYADGKVQIGSISAAARFLDPAEAAGEAVKKLGIGERTLYASGYAELTPSRQLRVVEPTYTLNPPADLTTGSGGVVRVDFRSSASSQYLVTARQDGTVEYSRVSIVRPLGGGKPRSRLTSIPVAFAPPPGVPVTPDWLFATGDGSNILAVWKNGAVQRYALKQVEEEVFALAETAKLAIAGRPLTHARMLLGSRTLLIGDAAGSVRAVFSAKTNSTLSFDGWQLAVAHTFGGDDATANAGCSAMGIALRDRSVVMADTQGHLTIRHVTSEKLVAESSQPLATPPSLALITPKGDGVVTLAENGAVSLSHLDAGHAEASVKSLFGKVWYEGDAAPSYTYQASTGEDTAEVKYSTIPLIFGTLKSTFYSMLFAVPLAILAALYTSEFLHPKVKNRVKPVIEMMASLPSVVLGFLAAIVIAPLFRDYLPGVLLAFFVVPVGVLMAGYVWQLLPTRLSARVGSLQHATMVLAVVLVCGAFSIGLGRVVERAIFTPSDADVLVLAGSVKEVQRSEFPPALIERRSIAAEDVRPFRHLGFYYAGGTLVRPAGSVSDPQVQAVIKANDLDKPDMRRWLDGLIGTPRAGWILILTPVGVLLASLLRARIIDERLAGWGVPRVGPRAAATEIGKFVATLALGMGIASILATLFSWAGFDARDSLFGTYSQRNTLVVAVAMGFAIIPIIYTISEDSLSAVPGQLRSASLGCGATRWQTATRVVLPIALSGIFSAVMIGLGRAAGETMIVLMATGNTPDMDWNIFSGFRTLSANIATEMPEAPVGSTHYRVLFLGAVCLFALTFIVNTLAEIIRQRVRAKRAGL